MKKSIVWTIILILLFAICNFYLNTIDNNSLRNWILGLVQFSSDSEIDYAASFLDDSLFLKGKIGFGLLSILIIVFHRYIFKLGLKFIEEIKSISVFDRASIFKYDQLWVVKIMGILLIIGIIVIPFIQINSDEAYAYTYFTSQNPLISITVYPAPNNHILYSFISSIFDKIIPWKLYALRLPSLIAGVLAIGILLSYVQRNYQKKAILLSGMAVLVSFYPMFYLVQGRGYALFFLWTSMLTIIVLESCRKRKWYKPIISVVVSVLGFYTIPLFLYPFTISLFVMLLFVPWKSVITLGFTTLIITLIFYAPIIAFFGIDAIIGNEFVDSLTMENVWARYPSYLSAKIVHIIAVIVVLILSVIAYKNDLRNERYLLIICMVTFTLLIPFLQRVFPPFRSFIYLFPIAFIVLTSIINEKKRWWLFIPLLVIYNLYFAQKNYFEFNKYSIEAHDILAKALKEKKEAIYLLDGPRSIFQWYLEDDIASEIIFHFSLNRDSLNQTLLENDDMLFISEYRYKQVFNNEFQAIDSTNYFMLFRRK